MAKKTKTNFTFKPIGTFKTSQVHPYQAARQPDDLSEPGTITLTAGKNFEQALKNLHQCSHIWIIYVFHHNEKWKPQVATPRSKNKIGVFATRAPYRPNPIGMSCVKILKIKGLKIDVDKNDLLDGTPILDIKPYHPQSDVITDAEIGWLDSSEHKAQKMQVRFSPRAEDQMDFLEIHGLKDLKPFIIRQLEYDPTDKTKKRVKNNKHFFTLAYRTWRADFVVIDESVTVLQIHSGYSPLDLDSEIDKYKDKPIHRIFIKEFN